MPPQNEGSKILILDFQMNSLTTVESIGHGLWRVVSRTEDDLFSARVALDVKAPGLDIRRATLEVERDDLGIAPDLFGASEKLVGVRVGQGMTKIVRALLGGPQGSDRIAEMVLEAMEMLVNAITVPELRKATEMGGQSLERESDGRATHLQDRVIGDEMVRVMASNPRLKDSCAAFRDL